MYCLLMIMCICPNISLQWLLNTSVYAAEHKIVFNCNKIISAVVPLKNSKWLALPYVCLHGVHDNNAEHIKYLGVLLYVH